MKAFGLLTVAIGLAVTTLGCTQPALDPLPEYADQQYTDAWITRQVTVRLHNDLQLNKYLIHVQSADSIVYLQGTVPSAALRKRAADIATGSRYVWGVHNNITVSPTAPPDEGP
jgi:osmotically-inducible protein OsmY